MNRDKYISVRDLPLQDGGQRRPRDGLHRPRRRPAQHHVADGRRGTGQGRVHWSANFDEIQDFEHDIRESFEGFGFMPEAEFAARLDANGVYDPFGKPAAGVCKELDGLLPFSGHSTRLREARSAMRTAALRRMRSRGARSSSALNADCATRAKTSPTAPRACSTTWGRSSSTSGSRLGGKLDGTDTPSLKGVWQTGAVPARRARCDVDGNFYEVSHQQPDGHDQRAHVHELSQLERYMLELDDVPETIAPPEPPLPPPGGDGSSKLFSCSTSARSPSGEGANPLGGLWGVSSSPGFPASEG